MSDDGTNCQACNRRGEKKGGSLQPFGNMLVGTSSGECRECKEKRRVGRNLQIEIIKAVYQYAGNSDDRRQAHRRVNVSRPVLDFAQASAIENSDEPAHDGKAYKARFDSCLNVVIMSFVHEEVGVETAVRGVDHGECT